MLRVIHEDEVILEIDQQVLSATLRTNRGSGPPTFLDASTGVIELVIEKVPTGGPMRLDQIEAAQILAIQERGTEGETIATQKTLQGKDAGVLNTGQGSHFDTLGKGESDKNIRPDLIRPEDDDKDKKDKKKDGVKV